MKQQVTIPAVWKQQQQRQERRGYILSVSLMVWRDIVPLAVPTGVRGEWRVGDCVGLMALADALFPLVPRACRAVMGAGAGSGVVEESDEESDGDGGPTEARKVAVVVHTSRFFGLRCAGLAGSKRCVEWIVGHTLNRRNNDKECLAVLKGLCAGGHLKMAQELADGRRPCYKSLRWPPDMDDSLREMSQKFHSVLFEACKGGNLDTVKWVMSRFGVGTEDWELIKPFLCAVRRGHVDIVKWLASTTGVLVACSKALGREEDLPGSASVEVVKLCMEWFFSGERLDPAVVGYWVLLKYMELAPQQRDDTEFEEGCQWIKDTFEVPINSCLLSVRSSKGLKWVLDNVPEELTKSELMNFSTSQFFLGHEEIVSSCITELSPVTPHDLVEACGNEKDNVETVKFILSMTTTAPTAKDLQECLVQALSVNNTSIAEWLENTFHVMCAVNSDPFNTEETFVHICWRNPGSRGMKWFLSHAKVCNISPKTVENAVLLLRRKPQEFGVFLDTIPAARCFRVYTVTCAVESWSLSQTMHFVSESRGFSTDKIIKGLKGSSRVQSGKVVRWLVQSFLSTQQKVTCGNHLLRLLIEANKVRCAEWLIHACKISFDEVIKVIQTFHKGNFGVKMWKMLLRVFPRITAEFVKEHLVWVVFMSPLHTTVSMRTLGLTKDDVLAVKGQET